MKRIAYLVVLLVVMLLFRDARAQEKASQEQKPIPTKEEIVTAGTIKDPFDKKFRFGVSYHFNWGTIQGDDLPEKYFLKPCVGFNIRAEYYPLSFLGIGAGVGYMQRGAGIINPDTFGGSFSHPWVKPNLQDTDSTHAEKLRVNTIEVPLTLLLRTPNDVFKGVRLSAAAGVVFIHNFRTNNVWLDVVGGNHEDHFVTNKYVTDDLGYQLSFGPDINAGSTVFQVHAVYTKGTKNVYTAGQGDGRQMTIGLRVAWLF
jgi:hypothetical protein